jgi:hypothetical protein
MERSSGEQFGFELRRPEYSNSNPYAAFGNLTMALPLTDDVPSEPLGDVAVTGTITKAGLASLSIYLPDGGRSTYKGPILESDLLAINTISREQTKAALIGPINMASTRASLNYDGILRLYAQSIPGNPQYVTGIDQQRAVLGSRYVPPSKGFFPISGIIPVKFNTSYNLVGGDFDGISKIGSWEVGNKIAIPGSPVDSSKASFTTKTGLVTFVHTLTDANFGIKTTANGFAVTLQRPRLIRGYYKSTFTTGQFTVIENDGTIPSITSISPVNKTVSKLANTYFVQVNTPGAWQVTGPGLEGPVDPEIIPRYTVEIVAGGTGGLNGTGPGTVKITVTENPTNLWYYVTLEIAGIDHNLTQDYTIRR